MEPRINVVTLGVANIERATKFYVKLGWKKSASSNEHFTLFRSKGVLMALYGTKALAEDAKVKVKKRTTNAAFRGVTLARNVESKAAVRQALKKAKGAGGKILKPAQEVFWGGYSGYFADPDGHLWEVAWNPHWKLTADGGIELKK